MNKAKLGGLTLALLLALGPAHSAIRAADAEPPRVPIGGALIVDRSDDANVATCGVATNDCTLRGAINKVNLSGVGQEIQFAPAITQVNLSAALPVITTTGTIIRGTAGVPRINGANLAGSGDDMFTLDTGDTRITGLTMINGRRSDIMVKSGAANQIDNNYLGVASPLATGCLTGGATRMGSVGIWLQENVSASGGTSVWIHGNVIGCHEFDGISAFGADDTKIGIDPAGAPSGNWVGTTATVIGGSYTGEILPNRHGIALGASGANGARRNVIRNNVIANNTQLGVTLEGNSINDINGTSGNTIAANLIVNNLTGIWLSHGAFWNVIGGAADGDGNTVYANSINGINVYDSDLNGILGNTIGAQDPATANNGYSGILIANGNSNWIGGIFAIIAAPERGNVIIGNGDVGIWLSGASKTTVTRNWIGNTPSGAIRPNVNAGILINAGAYSNTIGTGVISQLNVIGGNDGAGIVIDGSATMSNAVRLNDIGVNSALTAVSGPSAARDAGAPMAAATIALPNDHGIVIRNGAHDNTVADSNWIAENRNNGVWLYTGAAENIIGPNNVIFNNDGDGIALSDAATEFNTILTSTIYANRGDGIREYRSATNNAWVATRTYANGGLGIDKAAESSVTNIPTAGWPVITSVVRSGGIVTLTGTSDAAAFGIGFANTTRVYVFHSGLDPSGYGEGQTFVGDAPTDSNGIWRVSYTEGATPRCYAAYKRSFGLFFLGGYDYGSEFSPSTCVPKLAYVPRALR